MNSNLYEIKEEQADSLQRPAVRIKFDLRFSKFLLTTFEHLVISGFRRAVDEKCTLHGCYAARSGDILPNLNIAFYYLPLQMYFIDMFWA
jgi:hypothetical protein